MKRLASAAAHVAIGAATLILPSLAFTAPTLAAEYELDTSHTYVGFVVNHLGFSETHGAFKNVTGKLTLDEAKPEAATVDVSIDVKSIDSGWEKRDDHLRNADFFNVEKFPTMTFKSTKVEVTGKETATLTGDLTLLGVTKPVTLAVKLNQAGASPMAKDKFIAGFSASGKLKRSDFGMTKYVPALGDEVTLVISTEAVRK